MVISFLVLWSICLSSSLVHFRKGPEYLTRGTAQVFIPLIRFLLESLSQVVFSFSWDILLKFCLSFTLVCSHKVLVGGLSLESEWQKVSSGLQAVLLFRFLLFSFLSPLRLLSTITWSSVLAGIRWSVCISKSQRIECMDYRLCMYISNYSTRTGCNSI